MSGLILSYTLALPFFGYSLVSTFIFSGIIETLYKVSIGQVRFQQKGNLYFDIDIYIVKEKREMGAAFKALNLSMNQLNNGVLRAIVKKNNEVSFNFFKKCGFKLNSENNLKWVLTKKLDS